MTEEVDFSHLKEKLRRLILDCALDVGVDPKLAMRLRSVAGDAVYVRTVNFIKSYLNRHENI